MESIVLQASNIHCYSCVSHISDVCFKLPGVASFPEVSLATQTIRVVYDGRISGYQPILDALTSSAVEIKHVTVYDKSSSPKEDFDHTISSGTRLRLRAQQKHMENCDACKEGPKQHSPVTDSVSDTDHRPAIIQIDSGDYVDPSAMYTASVSIEGMTCGSCVGTITRKLQELDYVTDVSIDLLNNSGSVKFRGKERLDEILETFDDIGYSATLLEISSPTSGHAELRERVVDIQVHGMHCVNCPERVIKALEASLSHEQASASHFKVSRGMTIKDPRVKITYQPDPSQGVTVRHFISTIRSVDPTFTVDVYHPPTLEERSRRLQHHERWAILQRLVFTGIVAIPTFVIGVVYMALVPKRNPTRVWLEEPMWAGNATRMEWVLFIMTTPVMAFGTDLFHRRAYKEIWAMWRPRSTTLILRRFYRFGSMNMLISVGTTVAYIASLAVLAMNASSNSMNDHERMLDTYFDVIVFLTFFILIGKYLEAYSKAKTGDAVAMLAGLRPNEAYLLEETRGQKVSVDQLEVGDIVQVPQGHSPPADGVIEQDGLFSFDESSLTGESKPVKKSRGDTVFTGTVNVANPVEIRVTEVGGSSMLDQIIEVVRDGQTKRAPIERFADSLTGYFVPIVTLLAILTWVIWLSLGLTGRLPRAWLDTRQGGWAYWSLEFAIAVFVVACPCGIGLAAPTALFVGGGLAARRGILVQGGGQAFQEASSLDAIVFDKTGTLTQGKMQVTQYEELSETYSKDIVLAISNAMEGISSHPIAQAVAAFSSGALGAVVMSDVRELPGYGMTAKFSLGPANGRKVIEAAIGNEKLLHVLNAGDPLDVFPSEKAVVEADAPSKTEPDNVYLQHALYRHQSKGHSIALVAIRQSDRYEAVGIFGLSDPLRPEAPEVIASLRKLGLSIHLCTGDNSTTANAVASQLNIPASNVRAGVLPQGKADYIRELQIPKEGSRKIIAFVGDGLNDTPALTAADVSVSLSSGSDIAINASSFILLNSHLSAIYSLVKLSKRVFRRVKLNFFWAGIYNVTLIPVAAGVFYSVKATQERSGWRMNPVWASVAMAGSSVSVVVSSLALKLPETEWAFWKQQKNPSRR
ncbi:heavy metal translocatin, partial [Aureobasidium melanogenum]